MNFFHYFRKLNYIIITPHFFFIILVYFSINLIFPREILNRRSNIKNIPIDLTSN